MEKLLARGKETPGKLSDQTPKLGNQICSTIKNSKNWGNLKDLL
jgi:hypothetical protein